MLEVPEVLRAAGAAVDAAGPVMTCWPGCKPLTTSVLVLSALPVWMGVRTGAPF
jgi:hypothetical protein